MFSIIVVTIILLMSLLFILNMDKLTQDEKKYLKKSLWISIPILIIIGIMLYFNVRNEYAESIWYHIWLIIAIFSIIVWIIWGIVYFLYITYITYIKKTKMGLSLKIVTLFVVFTTFALMTHDTFFRHWIEQEVTGIYFSDVGELTIFQPTLFNDNYIRFVNFSLHNTYPTDITADLEFNIKFSDLKHNHSVVDFYPDYNILYEENTPYEIFYRWSGLKVNETTYLNFSIDWSEESGDIDYNPIDLSSDGTYIKFGNYDYYIYVQFITKIEP